jgi:hypothetical protein
VDEAIHSSSAARWIVSLRCNNSAKFQTFRPRTKCARSVSEEFARENRGRGNTGCPLHAQPRVQCCGTRAWSPHSHRNYTGIPARNGFMAYVALSRRRISSFHRHQPIWIVLAKSGLPALTNLHQQRCQDRTILPSAATSHVGAPFDCSLFCSTCPAPNAAASIASDPNVRDDSQRSSGT